MANTPEPVLDMSEILGLYKEDARRMIGEMRAAVQCWEEIVSGGPALKVLRRLSHQLRGSGRTYGYRNVTSVSKALEKMAQLLEKHALPADAHTRQALDDKINRLASFLEA